ncbi:MAG: asparagine synthase (glutamine-hydrolyzing) [Candidatus Eisenbacteria bacterium]|nr:asparagine synthase (glutamine-hydrolyzing) [Candidatus Eisenbacteria bacterium]
MCGIFGFFGAEREASSLLAAMAASLVHRGPDDEGWWTDGEVGLGNRRLAIVDVAHGRQPIWNETEDLVLVMNGEIYNAPALRAELAVRHQFRTHSDTEVVLHLFEDEGVRCLERLEGMFALALWDRRQRRLWLARDRAGEKPLFLARRGGTTYFASEVRALLVALGETPELDRAALQDYLTLGYVPAPRTLFLGIEKLPAGSSVIYQQGFPPRPSVWWSLRPFAAAGARAAQGRSLAENARRLRELLRGSVERQLMGDVPVGIALSGGLDSALIACHAAAVSAKPLRSFTLRFADRSFDESSHARALAERLGLIHHEIVVDAEALQFAAIQSADRVDEPLGDPALLPTLLLAQGARSEVKVLLSGEGADELFAGYPTYLGHRAVRRYRSLPAWLRQRLIEPLVSGWPASQKKVSLDYLLKRFVLAADHAPVVRHEEWFGLLPQARAARLLGVDPPAGSQPSDLSDPGPLARLLGDWSDFGSDPLPALLYLDFVTYLGDGLLTKLDRASMAHSLESRAPFLAVGLVEFAAGLPIGQKVRGLETKRVLRAAAAVDLPASWLRRRKRGLSVPLARLFRSEWRGWLDHELGLTGDLDSGPLDPAAVRDLRDEHLSGRVDQSRALWAVVSLLRWQRRWAVPRPPVFPSDCARRRSDGTSALPIR